MRISKPKERDLPGDRRVVDPNTHQHTGAMGQQIPHGEQMPDGNNDGDARAVFRVGFNANPSTQESPLSEDADGQRYDMNALDSKDRLPL